MMDQDLPEICQICAEIAGNADNAAEPNGKRQKPTTAKNPFIFGHFMRFHYEKKWCQRVESNH